MPSTRDDVTIRNTIAPGDLGAIIRLHGLLYAREYGYTVAFESYVAGGMHEFYRNYDPTRDRAWICEHAERIIGSLVLMHRPKNIAQLRYFLLVPEYRGIGLGTRLMELFLEFLAERGYASAYLWTTHELTAAASLYRKFGFTLTEEADSTAFGKPVREQRYELIRISAGRRPDAPSFPRTPR